MPRVKRGVTAVPVTRKSFPPPRVTVAAAVMCSASLQAVMRAGQYAYRDRRNKKRTFRALWITRINAASVSMASATACSSPA